MLKKLARLLTALAVAAGCYGFWTNGGSLLTNQLLRPAAGTEYGQELILVNQAHYIPIDYQPELTELANGQLVSTRIYPDLQRMFDDARALGYGLFVREGYRTQQAQAQLLAQREDAYRQEGYSAWEARDLARQWVAQPGTSEHQLGLAVDINPDRTISSGEAVYAWLAENAHRYGFVRRYPPEKTHITGVSNEPWHYRYVGCEAARQMYEQGLCLEEYIAQLDAAE